MMPRCFFESRCRGAIVIHITNTLSGKKEEFRPIEQNKVTMYVCGITPYDYAHLGHGRVAVVFDVLYRLFRFFDVDVKYCRNFTDIDDKLLNKAQREFGDPLRYAEIAQRYMTSYTEDMNALNCLLPDVQPRVTENIPDIIAFVQGLLDAGHAYVMGDDVYFGIRTFPNYGVLSKHKLEDLRAGARVEVNDEKRDPLDFVLWKGAQEGMFWKSPWGWGRPGWHIECSVMASKYLGKHIDIHGGGMDLVFPHHENEIAQSEAGNKKRFANYWMHNAFVRINKEKMSKSLGNFFTLQQIFEKFEPSVVRYYYLNHHYRAPLDFAFDDLESVRKSYQRLCRAFEGAECSHISKQQMMDCPLVREMLEFLCDDLNTPGMFGVVFQHLDALKNDERERCMVKLFLATVLGLTLEPLVEKQVELTPEIRELLAARTQARREKNWARADMLRQQLIALGVEVKDEKL
jgi:cysteinyl-tRNA synthetase